MASFAFDDFKRGLLRAEYDLSAADNIYYLALVNTSAFDSSASNNYTYWGSVSADWSISADPNSNSYEYYDKGLSGCNVWIDTVNNESQWSASNVTWTSATIDARGVLIYRLSTGTMLCAIDFGSRKSSINGDFTLRWNDDGIINLG